LRQKTQTSPDHGGKDQGGKAQGSKAQGSKAHYGWVMVFVGFTLMAMSFGGLAAVGVFLKPIAAEFGWSRGSIAFGYTTAALSAALFGIFWGFLADRYPTVRFTMLAAIGLASAMLLLSQTTSQWQFYLFYFLFGSLGHGTLQSSLWSNIGQWFAKNKGLALGVGLAGGAFGQAVVPLIARVLISSYGWQDAYMILGIGYLILGLAVAALTRDPPAKRARLAAVRTGEHAGNVNAWSLGEGRHTVFWFSMAVLFCCSCMSVVIVHLVPMLTDRGFNPEVAATALAALMLSGVIGRLAAGKACDLFGVVPTYAFMAFGQTVLVAWFPYVETLWGIYLLAVIFGFVYSGVMASAVICVNVQVPAEVSARCWSIVSFFAWVGMGTGAFMGGYLYDLTGGYTTSFSFAAIVGTINLLILLAYRLTGGHRRAVLVEA
jgi:MFS family permease